jgi:DNA-binding beta-propeller fold protein YncE
MKKTLRYLAVIMAILALVGIAPNPNQAAAAGTRLFGTVGNADTGTSDLVELDPTTGALLQTIGPVDYIVNGLDYDPVSGRMYATTSSSDSTFANGLLTIDITTGAATPVGPENLDWNSINNVRADSTGQLFAWDGYHQLLTIDPETGIASNVNNTPYPIFVGRHGAAFAADGTFYLVEGYATSGNIFTVDPADGTLTDTGKSVGTVAHHGDINPVTGEYWGINQIKAGAKTLLAVDLATGQIAQALPTVNDLHTVAFMPSTVAALTYLDVTPRYPSRLTDYINLRWGGSTTPGVTYELERSVNGGNFVKIYSGSLTATRFRAALTPRGQHIYRARAVKGGYVPSAWRTSQPIMVR